MPLFVPARQPRFSADLFGGFLPGNPGSGIGIGNPGGSTGQWPGPGGIVIGVPFPGSSGGAGNATGGVSTVSAATTAAGWLLGIDWGRIAAFLLGLLLIAGGIYLIPTVRNTVNVTVKRAGTALAEAGAAGA